MKRTKTRMLCEGAITIALAQILSYLKLYEMPYGGSVTFCMLPIFIYCVRWGFGPGMLASFAYSILQAALSSFPGAVPAGAFYQRVTDPMIPTEDADKALSEAEKQLRLSGIILKDLKVTRLMDEQELTLGRLFNKDGSPSGSRKELLEEEEIRRLGRYAASKARELAERIAGGEIERLPLVTVKRRACDYCPYQNICRIDWQAGDQGRAVAKMSLEELVEKLGDEG